MYVSCLYDLEMFDFKSLCILKLIESTAFCAVLYILCKLLSGLFVVFVLTIIDDIL